MLLALLAATALTSCNPKFEIRAAPAVTFMTVKGEKFDLHALRGKVLLVNFWATDCPVCIKEMPQLVATYRKFAPRGFDTVAVAMWYDPPNRVLDYTGKNTLPFNVSFDPVGDIARAFGDITLTPTTFVIDKRGNIVERILGEPNFGKLNALIEAKLGETI
jgi:peroxiredoxin